MMMSEINNQKIVETVISELRNSIGANIDKLMKYIGRYDNGQFPLPDETVGMLLLFFAILRKS